ncbi:LysR family transcriptional regulator [Xenophilus sp.]|uniref:LysR family transcriptional regulator n=2 Tax=Xenophilus sp. TaxID=1873499 RepID=UPI0037DC1688
MARRNLNDLLSFVTIAREGSFTRAAALLGVTQSALSQAISGLEARLRIRLLTRTTRSVSPTAAGERLLNAIGHRFDEIEAELDALTELRDKPSGTVRITCGDNVLHTLLLPRLAPLLREYPDIALEFDVNYGLRDIVADRFDAGVRLGSTIDKDMIAVPLGPPLRMAVVAAPAYLADRPAPSTPHDLTAHNCINQRMPTSGGLYVWDFERKGRRLNVRVDGQLIFNTTQPQVDAALAGLGITLLPEDEVTAHIEAGRLVRLLEDWCPPFAGYHLYYPSRRQPSPAFALVVDALRYSAPRPHPARAGSPSRRAAAPKKAAAR